MLVPTNESKENIKNYEDLWSKIRDLIRLITKNSDNYDKTTEIPNMIIVVRVVFL